MKKQYLCDNCDKINLVKDKYLNFYLNIEEDVRVWSVHVVCLFQVIN